MREVKRHPLLSAAEEVRLARRARAGDARARERLIVSNLRLVVRVALRYAGNGVPLQDLVQEGNVGLMRAVRSFDWRLGYRFSTYAIWWIHQAITRYLERHARGLRLPPHVVRKLNRLDGASRQLIQQLQAEPDPARLAEALGWPEEVVRRLLAWRSGATSLEEEVAEGDITLKDVLAADHAPDPEEEALRAVTGQELRRALERLPDRQRQVLWLRFGLGDGRPRTLEETSRALNISREGVLQIEKRALAHLRHLPEVAGRQQS
ncbi:MAG: sigma-70 family RNA polymerase sigma factor [Firmicutes bacterium]|nr:sigma-70 family RNA polymerase sigma factor [Bacillota bacterium]